MGARFFHFIGKKSPFFLEKKLYYFIRGFYDEVIFVFLCNNCEILYQLIKMFDSDFEIFVFSLLSTNFLLSTAIFLSTGKLLLNKVLKKRETSANTSVPAVPEAEPVLLTPETPEVAVTRTSMIIEEKILNRV